MIRAGIGDKFSLFIDYFTTFVAGIVIGFIINWKLALIGSIMLPLIIIEASLNTKVNRPFLSSPLIEPII